MCLVPAIPPTAAKTGYELAIVSTTNERTAGIIPVEYTYPLNATRPFLLLNTIFEDDVVLGTRKPHVFSNL